MCRVPCKRPLQNSNRSLWFAFRNQPPLALSFCPHPSNPQLANPKPPTSHQAQRKESSSPINTPKKPTRSRTTTPKKNKQNKNKNKQEPQQKEQTVPGTPPDPPPTRPTPTPPTPTPPQLREDPARRADVAGPGAGAQRPAGPAGAGPHQGPAERDPPVDRIGSGARAFFFVGAEGYPFQVGENGGVALVFFVLFRWRRGVLRWGGGAGGGGGAEPAKTLKARPFLTSVTPPFESSDHLVSSPYFWT